jgi:hypothetical protein
MAYFALANARRASEITFQHVVRAVQQLHFDIVSSQCSYAKINRNPPDVRAREEKCAVLSYQFVSGVYGISFDKFEARSLKILFQVLARSRARVKAEFP